MRIGLIGFVDCAHRLEGAGICERPHGHTYRVEAVLEATLGRDTDLEALRRRFIRGLDQLDHSDLNDRMPYPSCENFCSLLFGVLKADFPGLARLKVWEGEGKWAEVRVDDPFPTYPAWQSPSTARKSS